MTVMYFNNNELANIKQGIKLYKEYLKDAPEWAVIEQIMQKELFNLLKKINKYLE